MKDQAKTFSPALLSLSLHAHTHMTRQLDDRAPSER